MVVTAAPITAPRRHGRGCGRSMGRAAVAENSPPQVRWKRDTTGFTERQFSPNEPPGRTNIPNSINVEHST